MFQIGELAKRCGVSTDTLRFYEKMSWLLRQRAPSRAIDCTMKRASNKSRFILKAKELGLSLEEIKELLEIRLEATEHSCAEVKAITSAKLAVIDQKIEELTRIRSALKKSMMPAVDMSKIMPATARF